MQKSYPDITNTSKEMETRAVTYHYETVQLYKAFEKAIVQMKQFKQEKNVKNTKYIAFSY